ncbi:asparagine synthase C-terminal domain-containing protein [Halolamina salifodinae]|uniref:Asparagine synthase (Glutamine-hydrolyzing) n=1 Tax=Halolamina salifodinae TaxID=1202767 RepID=A0A8T4GXS0_9EURY|nr:asparagine synthase-related protein [Halolamina salifodinae]MBP1986903.1 asparagine synthase (glutamine-hydrolyzing) [Halolamina salifodinae]
MPDSLRGADVATVRPAIGSGDPLPGTAGFGGAVDDRVVRDVLGREPVYLGAAGDDRDWSFDPTDFADPELLDAGTVVEPDGERRKVWPLPTPEVETDHEAAIDAVREAVLTSVREPDPEGLAVAFSGGVDSAIVAAGVPEAPCYVAGFAGAESHDVEAAREAADAMDRDLRIVEFDHDDIVRAVPEIARATGRTNAMDIQIALPLYFVAERAAADGFDRLAVGQGADELFGGYRKVVDPESDHRVDADTVRGATREVIQTLPDQLPRDVLTLRAAGVEPVAPLLHDRVVDAALRLPAELLASEAERKIALRRAATGVVPEPVRTKEKKAVQYGTYAARELDRLARQAGYKRRMENHVGQYIDALLAE